MSWFSRSMRASSSSKPTWTCSAADHHAPRRALHFLEQRDVALLVGALLRRGERERMARRRDRREAVPRALLDHGAAQLAELQARLADRAAHGRRDLDLRAQELRERAPRGALVQVREELRRRVARDRARLAVHEQVLLLDAEGERRLLRAHAWRRRGGSVAPRTSIDQARRAVARGSVPSAPRPRATRAGPAGPRCRRAAGRRPRRGGRRCSRTGAGRCRARCRRPRGPRSRAGPSSMWRAEASSRSQSTPTCQGRSAPRHLRREGVHRHEERHHAARAESAQHGGDRLVVRVVEAAEPRAPFELVHGLVARDHPAVALAPDRLRVVRRPVAVHDEARIAGEHRRCVERIRDAPREFARARGPRRCAPRSAASGSPSRRIAFGKARLAWSQATSAGAAPCSCSTTNGGGSSRPMRVWLAGRWSGLVCGHVGLARGGANCTGWPRRARVAPRPGAAGAAPIKGIRRPAPGPARLRPGSHPSPAPRA